MTQNNTPQKDLTISDFDLLVLKEIANFKNNHGWMVTELIELEFGDNDEYESLVRKSTLNLLALKYIKGSGDPNPDGTHDAYSITPHGKQFLNKNSFQKIMFHNIANSNIVINSSNVIQELKIENEDIKQKIAELEKAMKEKDSSLLKKSFEYIADKSIDIAIALLLNGMIK